MKDYTLKQKIEYGHVCPKCGKALFPVQTNNGIKRMHVEHVFRKRCGVETLYTSCPVFVDAHWRKPVKMRGKFILPAGLKINEKGKIVRDKIIRLD